MCFLIVLFISLFLPSNKRKGSTNKKDPNKENNCASLFFRSSRDWQMVKGRGGTAARGKEKKPKKKQKVVATVRQMTLDECGTDEHERDEYEGMVGAFSSMRPKAHTQRSLTQSTLDATYFQDSRLRYESQVVEKEDEELIHAAMELC